MVKLLLKILVLYALTLNISCFRKNTCENAYECLPPITSEGKNTFGCIVNDNAFIPEQVGIGGGVVASYMDNGVNTRLFLGATNSTDGTVTIDITEKIESGMSYSLNDYEEGNYRMYADSNGFFYSSTMDPGTIYISRFDLEAGIVSGTFFFTAVDELQNTLKIESGRFDIEL